MPNILAMTRALRPTLSNANGLISMRSRQSWHRGHCDIGFHIGHRGLLLGLSVYRGGVVELISEFHSLGAVTHYGKNTHFCGSAKSLNRNHTNNIFLSLNTVLNSHKHILATISIHFKGGAFPSFLNVYTCTTRVN